MEKCREDGLDTTNVNGVSVATSVNLFVRFFSWICEFRCYNLRVPSDDSQRRSSEEILVLCRSSPSRTRLSWPHLETRADYVEKCSHPNAILEGEDMLIQEHFPRTPKGVVGALHIAFFTLYIVDERRKEFRYKVHRA